MSIAILGGSFDPPHIGHAILAQWIVWSKQAERVIFVPAFHHADKEGTLTASFEDRVRMVTAMCDAMKDERFTVSDIECHLPTPSYTINTLEHFAHVFGPDVVRLAVGVDAYRAILRWERGDEILATYDPIVVGREGHMDNPMGGFVCPGISSTLIRRNPSLWGTWVFPAVAEIMREVGYVKN